MKTRIILLCLSWAVLGVFIHPLLPNRLFPGAPELERLKNLTLNDISALATAGGFIGIVVALLLQIRELHHGRQIANRDATEAIFRRWWGLEGGYPESDDDKHHLIRRDLPGLRKYFYGEFMPWYEEHQKSVTDTPLKDFAKTAATLKPPLNDMERLSNLTFFFDEVGWLGAADLIDVDHVLGPMQHVLRRVWWISKSFIDGDRKKTWLDPVRHFGIEWLYQQSVVTPQIDLIKARFLELPPLAGVTQKQSPGGSPNISALRERLVQDEATFLLKVPEEVWEQVLKDDKTLLSWRKWGSAWKHFTQLETTVRKMNADEKESKRESKTNKP